MVSNFLKLNKYFHFKENRQTKEHLYNIYKLLDTDKRIRTMDYAIDINWVQMMVDLYNERVATKIGQDDLIQNIVGSFYLEGEIFERHAPANRIGQRIIDVATHSTRGQDILVSSTLKEYA